MKKAFLFLSLVAFLGFTGCEEENNSNEVIPETSSVKDKFSYTVLYSEKDKPAEDIVIFELDNENNFVKKQSIMYLEPMKEYAQYPSYRTITTSIDVRQIESYHRVGNSYYYNYTTVWSEGVNNKLHLYLTNKITKEQYDNATQR